MRVVSRMAFLLVLIAGCSQQPITSGGKPLEYWLEQARKQDPGERQQAIKALGRLGARDPAVLPAVMAAVEDRDPRVRAEAVLALLNIGPAARAATPVLEKATHDRDERVRRLAASALKRIG
jgi:HEAT repeat protein